MRPGFESQRAHLTNTPIIFKQIKRTNAYQSEYWSARHLAKVLDCKEYLNFETVIKKVKEACKNSVQSIKYHFGDVTDMIEIDKTASMSV